MKTFSHVFEKEASVVDLVRVAGRGLRDSAVGTHGLREALRPMMKNPAKQVVKGFRDAHPIGKVFSGLQVAHAATRDDIDGPAERIGAVVGNVLPIGLMANNPKLPGFLGDMALSDALGGGFFLNKGFLQRGGEKIDDLLGFGKKEPAPKTFSAITPHLPKQAK